jgi:hypothetical protein
MSASKLDVTPVLPVPKLAPAVKALVPCIAICTLSVVPVVKTPASVNTDTPAIV